MYSHIIHLSQRTESMAEMPCYARSNALGGGISERTLMLMIFEMRFLVDNSWYFVPGRYWKQSIPGGNALKDLGVVLIFSILIRLGD